MQEREWTYEDKDAWPPGPWHNEPDKVQWMTEAGLPGLIVRGPLGALCGYVGVPREHPWHGVEYGGCTLPDAKPRGLDKPEAEATVFEKWRAGVTVCDKDWCDHRPESKIDVHGGLTYSGACSPHADNPELGICHLPDAGEPDDVWWFGFDCAHSGDHTPKPSGLSYIDEDRGGFYHTIGAVRREVEHLASQILAARQPEGAEGDE